MCCYFKTHAFKFFYSVGNLESMMYLWEARDHILSEELSCRTSKLFFFFFNHNINTDVCEVKTEKPSSE